MRKLFILFSMAAGVLLFTHCSPGKKAAGASGAPTLTYTANIQPVIAEKCTPCHFPDKGRAKALNNYSAVKGNLDDIIKRVSMHPGDRGFMPMKHERLSDSTINMFRLWQEQGAAE